MPSITTIYPITARPVGSLSAISQAEQAAVAAIAAQQAAEAAAADALSAVEAAMGAYRGVFSGASVAEAESALDEAVAEPWEGDYALLSVGGELLLRIANASGWQEAVATPKSGSAIPQDLSSGPFPALAGSGDARKVLEVNSSGDGFDLVAQGRYRGAYHSTTMALALSALNAAVASPANGDIALLTSPYEGPALYAAHGGTWKKVTADRTNGAIRQWEGLEASFYSAKVLQVQQGSYAQGTPYREFSVPVAVLVNVSAVGLNGLAYDYNGGSPYITAGWYYLWAVGKSSTGDVKFLVSQKYGLTDFAAEKNAIDSSYDYIRMLPMAFYYNGASPTSPHVANSFRDYYTRGSYPHPEVYWTRFDEGTDAFKALNEGVETSATPIDLGDWVPETGRLAHLTLLAEWIGAGSSSGSARIYTSIGATNGYKIECGGATSGYPLKVRRDITIAVNSAEELSYICSSSDVKLTVFARGFAIEEPS